MKQLAGGKHMEYDCFSKTLKFEMNKFESIQGKQRGDTNQQHVSEWAISMDSVDNTSRIIQRMLIILTTSSASQLRTSLWDNRAAGDTNVMTRIDCFRTFG
jgi:hypothetical protein